MKSFMDCAIELGGLGFEVFPVKPYSKKPPMMKEFWKHASTDPEAIRQLWGFDAALGSAEAFNPAISTTRFRDGALLVLDVDPQHGGTDTLDEFRCIMGYNLPDTHEQHTPSGGSHHVYYVPRACAGSSGQLGPGLDIRSHHNYILGAGAETARGVYTHSVRPVVPAPGWLLDWAAAHPPTVRQDQDAPPLVDRRNTLRKAQAFLSSLPVAPEGQRDAGAFRAAAHLRELGLVEADAAEQMVLWFRYDGTLTSAEIEHATRSAYKYAKGAAGGLAPEAYFKPVQVPKEPEPEGEEEGEKPDSGSGSGNPLHLLNRDHFFIMIGNKARIGWEYPGPWGRPVREFLAVQDFRDKEAGNLMPNAKGDKMVEVAKEWLKWKHRKSFDAVVFAPGRKLPSRFYNTWRGLAYEPLAPHEKPTADMRQALDMFLTIVRHNYCGGNEKYFTWVINFFAHLIQKPYEKVRVAMVVKGGKGIGKSFVAQAVGALVEPHLFVASDQRYLVGNFNGHQAETTLFVLEEAFWGGSKTAEGMLKELVTGSKLTIEQKFREAFRADNYMRIVIIGNEEWQVPASLRDERRWMVLNAEMRFMPFETEADKMKAARWFDRLHRLLQNGGYRYLLTYLQGIDLEGAQVNAAPVTGALVEQIEHTLSLPHNWWLECLREGRLVEALLSDGRWPGDVEKKHVREAFTRYCDGRNITSRLPSAEALGKELHRVCPSLVLNKKSSQNTWIYRFPPLTVAREEWERVLGRAVAWPDDEEY